MCCCDYGFVWIFLYLPAGHIPKEPDNETIHVMKILSTGTPMSRWRANTSYLIKITSLLLVLMEGTISTVSLLWVLPVENRLSFSFTHEFVAPLCLGWWGQGWGMCLLQEASCVWVGGSMFSCLQYGPLLLVTVGLQFLPPKCCVQFSRHFKSVRFIKTLTYSHI